MKIEISLYENKMMMDMEICGEVCGVFVYFPNYIYIIVLSVCSLNYLSTYTYLLNLSCHENQSSRFAFTARQKRHLF